MSNTTLREKILDELEWELSIDAAHLGVAVDNGVVTLTRHVGSYAEMRVKCPISRMRLSIKNSDAILLRLRQ
jgi:hypothetical protein